MLDIGCGHGVPITEALIQDGFEVFGVDASPTLVAAFRERFPGAHVECNGVEDSAFFGRNFDGVVAWGLLFLLAAERQRPLIGRMAEVLKPRGQLLFTAPREVCTWEDSLTGLESRSLGREVYESELRAHGLVLTGNDTDEGRNYYYFATKS